MKIITAEKSVEVKVFGMTLRAYQFPTNLILYSRRKVDDIIPINSFKKLRENILLGNSLGVYLKANLDNTESAKLLKQEVKKEELERINLTYVANDNIIYPISRNELILWIRVLGEAGIPKFSAMLDTGLHSVFMLAENKALGIPTNFEEHEKELAIIQQITEEKREKLRKVSRDITNPILACNVYAANNQLVYGGETRNSYQGEDAAFKHHLEEIAEMIEVGAKLSGNSIQGAIDIAHTLLKNTYNL